MASHSHPSSTANLVGVHYRVGKKIGEGSFGVIFEGQNRRSGSCGLQLHIREALSDTEILCLFNRHQPAQLSDRRHQVCA